jgi:calcineurin-like phosphoesterase
MKILILGDIYGAAGLHAAQVNIPLMKEQLAPDLVIVNAENVSEGGKSLS